MSYGRGHDEAEAKAQKNKPQKSSTKAQLLAHLIPTCEKEYQTTFGRAWSDGPPRGERDDLRHLQVGSDA